MTLSRELKVGLFIGCTALLILLALLYLALGKGVFEQMHTFTLSSKSGDGFTEGMPVVFSGFNIGNVQNLELDEKGVVLIKIKIPQRHVKWIKSDSDFILYRPLIGGARIVVNTADLKSPALDERDIPEVTTINDINDAITRIEPVLEKVTQISENVELLTRNLSDPRGDLSRTLANTQKITTTLSSKKSLLEMAVSDEESVKAIHDALKKIKDITVTVDKLVNKIDHMADKTDEQVYGGQGALPQVNTILKDIAGKLQKLDKTVDNVNKISTDASDGLKDLNILRSDVDDALIALEDIIKKLESIIGSKKDREFKTP